MFIRCLSFGRHHDRPTVSQISRTLLTSEHPRHLTPFLATHPKNHFLSPVIATLPRPPGGLSWSCRGFYLAERGPSDMLPAWFGTIALFPADHRSRTTMIESPAHS